MPCRRSYWPEKNDARETQQMAVVTKLFEKVTPRAASVSICGVCTVRLPAYPSASARRSSARMKTMLGGISAARAKLLQPQMAVISASESRVTGLLRFRQKWRLRAGRIRKCILADAIHPRQAPNSATSSEVFIRQMNPPHVLAEFDSLAWDRLLL